MRGVGVGLATVLAGVGLAGFVGASALEDGTRALARGDATAAEASARRAERWRPWSSDASLTRGQALLALGDQSAARRAFRRAAKRDPNDYRAWLALAGLSEGDAASAALLRAAALNPIAVRTP
jgi:Flp pilus assembly protein TadD